MRMMKEFKEFAMRGNVVDIAVGIIIGGAFGKIVSSLVADVLMPPIGLLIGGVDFSELAVVIQQAENDIAEVSIRYGMFIQSILDFVIIAFAIFLVIQGMNRLSRKEEATPPPAQIAPPSNEEVLLTEIRDLLKK